MRTTQKQGRARGRGQRKPGNGNALNRVHESSGPEGKVRGTPQQIVDKYLALARDSQTAGDRVTAENFLQHAEHYQRILTQATQSQQAERRDESEAESEAQPGAGNGAGAGRASSEALTTIETEGEGSELLVEESAPAESSPAAPPAEVPKKPRGRKPKAPPSAGADAPAGTESNGHDHGAEGASAPPRRSRARRSGTGEQSGEAGSTDSQTPTAGSGAAEASTGNG